MNKNKIIFLVLGLALLVFVIFMVRSVTSGPQVQSSGNQSGDFTIWIVQDSVTDFNKFITKFKESYPQYANVNIKVESFSDNFTYQNSLSSALFEGSAPDVFVLSNSEKSSLEKQVTAVDPTRVSPNDFRTSYKTVFTDDLILSDPEDPNIEYLKGVPAGYETLGIIYNRRHFLKQSKLTNWQDFSQEIEFVGNKSTNVIPLAAGNASGVTRNAQFIATLFSLEGIRSLAELPSNKVKEVLELYKLLGSKNGDNRYDILSAPFIDEDDIGFFTKGDVAAMMGYPRDLLEIAKIGYQKSFLLATSFPGYTGKDKLQAIEYNYFVINKDTSLYNISTNFLSYLASPEGQDAYHEVFPYYLPAHLDIEEDLLEKKILPEYNIVYKNFIDPETQLVSFDTGNKMIFEGELSRILDMDSGYDEEFIKMKSYSVCSSSKYSSLLNLSSPCK